MMWYTEVYFSRSSFQTASLIHISRYFIFSRLYCWRYETSARSPNKLVGKQVVVRIENNEENYRYAGFVIMVVMRVLFARYLVNRGVVNRGRSVTLVIHQHSVTVPRNAIIYFFFSYEL